MRILALTNGNPGRRYAVPGIIAIAVFIAGYLVALYRPQPREMVHRERTEDAEQPPAARPSSGRCQYILIERNGAYLGQEYVPFDRLQDQLAAEYRGKVDFARIAGTPEIKFGTFVTAYDTALRSLGVPVQMTTIPVNPGIRKGPVEVHQNPWQYDWDWTPTGFRRGVFADQ